MTLGIYPGRLLGWLLIAAGAGLLGFGLGGPVGAGAALLALGAFLLWL